MGDIRAEKYRHELVVNRYSRNEKEQLSVGETTLRDSYYLVAAGHNAAVRLLENSFLARYQTRKLPRSSCPITRDDNEMGGARGAANNRLLSDILSLFHEKLSSMKCVSDVVRGSIGHLEPNHLSELLLHVHVSTQVTAN